MKDDRRIAEMGRRIRQWLPADSAADAGDPLDRLEADLTALERELKTRIPERMNHQPRKCLGWKTPYEVHHNVSLAVIV